MKSNLFFAFGLLALALGSSTALGAEGAGRGGTSRPAFALVAQDWLCDYAKGDKRKPGYDYEAHSAVYRYAARSALEGTLLRLGTHEDAKVNGCTRWNICLEFDSYKSFSTAMTSLKLELGLKYPDGTEASRFLFEIVSASACTDENYPSGVTSR